MRSTRVPRARITHAKGAVQAAQGLMTIEEVLARSEEKKEHGCLSEQLRIQGELLILQSATRGHLTGEDHFRRALDAARRQGALSWELRAATSIVRLWRDQHRMAKACKLLAQV
jgi:predicted ATPase